MLFFSRLFNKEDGALDEPKGARSERDFEARLSRFMKSRKNAESLKRALEEWDKEHRNVDDPDFITEEEKKKIMNELFPRRLAFDRFTLRGVSETESAFPPPVPSGSSDAVVMEEDHQRTACIRRTLQEVRRMDVIKWVYGNTVKTTRNTAAMKTAMATCSAASSGRWNTWPSASSNGRAFPA